MGDGACVTEVDHLGSEPEEPSEASSVDTEVQYEHDHHIAQAALVLFTQNLQFDWEQLTPSQQDIYHGMVGRYLQSTDGLD